MAIKICYTRSIYWSNYCQFFLPDAVSVVYQIILVSILVICRIITFFFLKHHLAHSNHTSFFCPHLLFKRDDVSKSTIGDKVYAAESYYDDYPDMAMGNNY